MKIFTHTQYQYKQNNTSHCHAELGWQRKRQSYSDGSDPAFTRRSRSAASDRSTKLRPTFGMSRKSMQALPSGKTLKQVQGDDYLVGNNTQPSHCHAELGSASDRSAKSLQSFGLSNKSMPTFPIDKTLQSRDILHEIKNLSQNLTFSQLLFGRVAKAVKQVQGDSSFGAYAQGDRLYFHPNINYRVSFGALKKNQFDGIDLAVIEKFKAPIEKFNSNKDLQNWARKQAVSIANNDFGGRKHNTRIQRKAILKEWSDYIFLENNTYNSTAALLIFNAITKDLKNDNDRIPPVLNKRILYHCISEIDKNKTQDKSYQFNLKKMYETQLQSLYLEDTKIPYGGTGWVVIPSENNDRQNFVKNVEKLKIFSHKNWCTKSFNAKAYLSNGDFHVYLENGQPKIGVRFVGDEIEEIQGEKNNRKIPILYFDEIRKHIYENGLKLTNNVQKQITSAQEKKEELEKIKSDLGDAIENRDIRTIFEYFGIKVIQERQSIKRFLGDILKLSSPDTTFTISEYKQPSFDITFSDLGIDENILLANVEKIKGDANFRGSQITNLGKLKSIGGNADFYNSIITNLDNLESIGGDARFELSQEINLGNLKSIGGDAAFSDSQITSLGKLKSIGGHAFFNDSQVINLDNLESIGKCAFFLNVKVTNLGKLKSIGEDAHFSWSKITNLSNLESINGYADFRNSIVTSLPKLTTVEGDAYFTKSKIITIPNLKKVGGDVMFQKSQLSKENKLQSVGGRITVDRNTYNLKELNKKIAEGYFD